MESTSSICNKDQAVLVVPFCKRHMVLIKEYCKELVPDFCHDHMSIESENKEVIVLIDVNNIQGIPEFVQDLYEVLKEYDVTIYSGVDYCKNPVTCLTLHIENRLGK